MFLDMKSTNVKSSQLLDNDSEILKQLLGQFGIENCGNIIASLCFEFCSLNYCRKPLVNFKQYQFLAEYLMCFANTTGQKRITRLSTKQDFSSIPGRTTGKNERTC